MRRMPRWLPSAANVMQLDMRTGGILDCRTMSVMREPLGNGPGLGFTVDEAFYGRPSPAAGGDPLSAEVSKTAQVSLVACREVGSSAKCIRGFHAVCQCSARSSRSIEQTSRGRGMPRPESFVAVDYHGGGLDFGFREWTTEKLGPRHCAYGKCLTLANPRPQLAALGRPGVHDPDQEACVHVNHEVSGDNRRPAALRSARASRAHWEISTLRSRNEACNRSRAASFELSSSLSSFAAIRMARRNTSDFGTPHLLANSSSRRTDSTSSE